MSRNIKITVEADNAEDSAIVSAGLNLFFRQRGVFPKLTTKRSATLMALGADEWSVNASLHRLVQDEGAAVELVDQPEPIVVTPPARPNPIE